LNPVLNNPQFLKRIYFTVTNDLDYDQRMDRICTSLAQNGYAVTLIGRRSSRSNSSVKNKYRKKKLNCWLLKGKFFYIEFNTRLFFYLLFQKMDAVCAIDLDTIIPVLYISKIKKIPRIYDAHELFCEMKEVVTRPFIYRIWKAVEKRSVPKFKYGYTVCQPIADEFEKMYGVKYEIIRNISVLQDLQLINKKEKYILYQGAVNEGRSFETLIPAMKDVQVPLIICGDGNFMQQAKDLVQKNNLAGKIIFKGMLNPDELIHYTINAFIGTTLFENTGKSNYFSLANRFFDYMHAGVPQLCVNYPAYADINKEYKIALLINDPEPATISNALNNLLNNDVLYRELQSNCIKAREVYNWQEEEKRLISFYKQILH
jgi:glycosyltransferase involved in cell wall biosynthesis